MHWGRWLFYFLKSLTSGFLLGRETRGGMPCFFGALLFIFSEIKSLSKQWASKKDRCFAALGPWKQFVVQQTLQSLLTIYSPWIWYFLAILSVSGHLLLLFYFLENYQPLPRSFLHVLWFSGSIIASALHRGYYCFNLPGNIMSHFNGFLLLDDSDSMNAHTHVYTFRAKPSL